MSCKKWDIMGGVNCGGTGMACKIIQHFQLVIDANRMKLIFQPYSMTKA